MKDLEIQLNEYVKPEFELQSNLSNIAAILNIHLDDINWVGFYLMDEEAQSLKLGPFQGMPATSEINIENGVCGACARSKESIIVDDVHSFAGHIACDFRSKSEMVVPIFDKNNKFYGLIDIDSPIQSRFTEVELNKVKMVSSLITKIL